MQRCAAGLPTTLPRPARSAAVFSTWTRAGGDGRRPMTSFTAPPDPLTSPPATTRCAAGCPAPGRLDQQTFNRRAGRAGLAELDEPRPRRLARRLGLIHRRPRAPRWFRWQAQWSWCRRLWPLPAGHRRHRARGGGAGLPEATRAGRLFAVVAGSDTTPRIKPACRGRSSGPRAAWASIRPRRHGGRRRPMYRRPGQPAAWRSGVLCGWTTGPT